jgi:thioredoxin-like negative regulator of GroEL
MGRTKQTAAQRKSKADVRKASIKAPTWDPEVLVSKGQQALADMQVELAEQFFSRALEAAPQDTNIMDALADVHLQLGNSGKAKELLEASTQGAPTENPYKWLFLGQLMEGEAAVRCYKQGIEVLTAAAGAAGAAGAAAGAEVAGAGQEGDDSRRVMLKQVAKAHCSIAEIYMTDLW